MDTPKRDGEVHSDAGNVGDPHEPVSSALMPHGAERPAPEVTVIVEPGVFTDIDDARDYARRLARADALEQELSLLRGVIDAHDRVDGHACVLCPTPTRDLFAIAYNACNAMEAALRGGGGWERARRKLAELRAALDRRQPELDAHFAAVAAARQKGAR